MIKKLNKKVTDEQLLTAGRPFCKGNWRIHGMLLAILIVFTFFGGFYLLDEYHFEADDERYVIPLLSAVPNNKANVVQAAWNTNTQQATNEIQQLATRVLPAVVGVSDTKGQIVASGVFINSRGYLVTTWHSISGLTGVKAQVRTNKGLSTYNAEVVRIQAEHDLVLLKLQTKDKFLYLSVPQNPELLMIDNVSSFGIGKNAEIIYKSGVTGSTPTTLNVAKRELKQILMTDAVYSWEQTGGPLVDNRGRLVGISLPVKNAQGSIDGYVVPSKFIRIHFSQWLPGNKGKKKNLMVK